MQTCLRFANDHAQNLSTQFAYEALAKEVFGIDLRLAPWPAEAMPYSFLAGDTMVANITAYRIQLRIDNTPLTAIQLGTVCTLPAFRGQGLIRTLMTHVLSDFQGMPLYLFANESVLGFYPRFGFVRQEYAYPITERPTGAPDHAPALAEWGSTACCEYARKAVPQSKCFAGGANEWLFQFYMKPGMAPHPISLPGGGLLFAEQEGDTLHVLEILAERVLDAKTLLPCLWWPGVKRVVWHVMADAIPEPYATISAPPSEAWFLHGPWPVLPKGCLPAFTHT